MLQNAYFLAKIGADTAESEQHFAGILPKTGNYPMGPRHRRAAAETAREELLDGGEVERAVRRERRAAPVEQAVGSSNRPWRLGQGFR